MISKLIQNLIAVKYSFKRDMLGYYDHVGLYQPVASDSGIVTASMLDGLIEYQTHSRTPFMEAEFRSMMGLRDY